MPATAEVAIDGNGQMQFSGSVSGQRPSGNGLGSGGGGGGPSGLLALRFNESTHAIEGTFDNDIWVHQIQCYAYHA